MFTFDKNVNLAKGCCPAVVREIETRHVDDSVLIDLAQTLIGSSTKRTDYFDWRFTTADDRILVFSADNLVQYEPFIQVFFYYFKMYKI